MSAPAAHRVAPGDCLASLAARAGMPRDRVWDDPENADLKNSRDPFLLRAGDRIHLPDPDCDDSDCDTGQRHRFRRLAPPVVLKVRLLENQEPRADLAWRLLHGDDVVGEGRTDGDGILESPIDPLVPEFMLELTPEPEGDEPAVSERYRLLPGHLDPPETIRGVQARLINLGINPGPVDDLMGPLTRAALRQFQHDNDLDTTGEPDQPTRDALVSQHGC